MPFRICDQLAARALTDRGHTVAPVIWDDDAVDWARYDTVVIRSCWDYHLDHQRFLSWLRGMHERGVPVHNDHRLVEWNIDKRYLLELGEQGVPIVETIVVPDGLVTATSVEALRTDRYVVKPTISASSRGLHVVDAGSLPFRHSEAVLVQPYLPQVVDGEKSVIVLGGAISHAVLKRPAPGDFRVQSEFGGSAEPCELTGDERALAVRVVSLLGDPPLYARVDLLPSIEGALLMELELIEPELFFHKVPEAVALFAAVLEARMP